MISAEFLPIALGLANKFIPSEITRIFNQPINMRLGTNNISLDQLADEISLRGLTFPDVMAIPEYDNWNYSDGKSRVCSSFVVDVLNHVGVLGNFTINSSQFHPRDL